MPYIEEFPDAKFGTEDEEVNWRAEPPEVSQEQELDESFEDEPASPGLIKMLGFDPDEITDEEIKESKMLLIRSELRAIRSDMEGKK